MTIENEFCGHPTGDCLYAGEFSALRKECEALRKDAEYYRWLRDHACTTQANTRGPIFRMDVQIVGKWHLGDAIDAARAEAPNAMRGE